MRHTSLVVAAATLFVAASAAASAQSALARAGTQPQAEPQRAPQVVSQAESRGESTASDTLRPGDIIRLQIWREPDLSGDFEVDPSGDVTVPKLGVVSVHQASPDSLRAMLLRGYAVYLRNPSVQVTVLRRINILGAVMKPGLYPVDPTMTIADAVAAAGGATPLGVPDKVDLIRGNSRSSERIASATRIADTPLQSGDQIYVPQRNWAERNAAFVTTGASIAASLLMAVILRR